MFKGFVIAVLLLLGAQLVPLHSDLVPLHGDYDSLTDDRLG
jgi:hypothetical protein